MPLITATRATELVPNFNNADLAVMQDIVNACSGLVERYCARTFAVTSYDLLIDGTGHRNLLLPNDPLVRIDRVLYNPVSVVGIGNLKTAVSRASFRLDATNLYLTSVASGVETDHTIARSSCPTLADLAAAVNAYSSEGWTATALGIYGTWSTADLYPTALTTGQQGAFECRWTGYSYLMHHIIGMPFLMSNPDIGEIVSPMGFSRGYQAYRVLYTAGYATIPYEIQQATAELSAAVYLNREVNPNLQSENLGGYSYSNLSEKTFDNLSIASKYALAQYRKIIMDPGN